MAAFWVVGQFESVAKILGTRPAYGRVFGHHTCSGYAWCRVKRRRCLSLAGLVLKQSRLTTKAEGTYWCAVTTVEEQLLSLFSIPHTVETGRKHPFATKSCTLLTLAPENQEPHRVLLKSLSHSHVLAGCSSLNRCLPNRNLACL